jgi:hypothetical protein
MQRKIWSVVALAVTLAVASAGLSTPRIAGNDAGAMSPSFRPGAVKPGGTRTFVSSGEFQVCNEGPAPVRMWVDNSLTDAPTDSLLEPGRCVHNMGHIMTFKNENSDPVMLYAVGSLGGKTGPSHGPAKRK